MLTDTEVEKLLFKKTYQLSGISKDMILNFNMSDIIKETVNKLIKSYNPNEFNLKLGKEAENIILLYREVKKSNELKKSLVLKSLAAEIVFNSNLKERIIIPDDIKKIILFKYKNKCALCNINDCLEIHHKNENPSDNRIENLLLLCPLCHRKIHI